MRSEQAGELLTTPQQLAVLGSPIAHSRSPRIHKAAYEALGLDWQYGAIDCSEDQLAALLMSKDDSWRGFSVTMPLKERAYALSTVRDSVAESSGVVNTLMRVIGAASRPAWAGFNTDVLGLAEALKEASLDATRTVVFGAGATAVSAVLAAQHLGARKVTVVARRLEAARRLATRFGVEALQFDTPEVGQLAEAPIEDAATLVISTLPGSAGRALHVDPSLLKVPLFDVAYDPWPSPLGERWRAAGGETYSGLGMLIHQALLQVRIFVGGDPSFELENESEILHLMCSAAAETDSAIDQGKS